jgi:hypothetical protein
LIEENRHAKDWKKWQFRRESTKIEDAAKRDLGRMRAKAYCVEPVTFNSI